MNKIKTQIRDRKTFVRLCLDDPKTAAKLIYDVADKLEQTEKSSETVNIISNLLYLSKKTIYLDCAK